MAHSLAYITRRARGNGFGRTEDRNKKQIGFSMIFSGLYMVSWYAVSTMVDVVQGGINLL